MSEPEWGVGDATTAKPFATATVGKETVELITGDHPHSRSDNRHYARWPDGRIEAFDGHRIQVKVEIETYNYLKESELSGDEVRKGGTGRIFFNGRQVYEWFFRDPQRACRQADHFIEELMACPADLWRAGEDDWHAGMINKKVYYRDTPAAVVMVILDQGCVVVRADTASGRFPRPAWHEEGDEEESEVKVEMFSPDLWWFRIEQEVIRMPHKGKSKEYPSTPGHPKPKKK